MSMLSSINDSRRDSVPFFQRESPIKNSTMSLRNNNEIYSSMEFLSPQSNFIFNSDKNSEFRAVENWERIYKK